MAIEYDGDRSDSEGQGRKHQLNISDFYDMQTRKAAAEE